MAVRTVDELLTAFRGFGIDEGKPEFIQMLEDISDSYGNSSDLEMAKEHIARLESELLESNQRYVDRFYSRSDESKETEAVPAAIDVEEKEDEVSEQDLIDDFMEEE